MNDPFLDPPILSSRYFYTWPNRFEEPFFAEGDGFRLGCRNQGQLQQENEPINGGLTAKDAEETKNNRLLHQKYHKPKR